MWFNMNTNYIVNADLKISRGPIGKKNWSTENTFLIY